MGKTRTEERVFCPDCSKRNIVCDVCWGMDGKPITTQNDNTGIFSYRDIMRTPDEYIGQNYIVTGVVKSVEKVLNEVSYIELLHESDGIEYTVHLQYMAQSNDMKILVGDKITSYGAFVSHDQNDVPALLVIKVTLVSE